MKITLTQPDDWHAHLRDGAFLQRTVYDITQQFARAIVMPNLMPPVLTVAEANAYKDRIMAHVPKDKHFTPLMTLYLTDTFLPETIVAAKNSGFIHACKLYPAGATTHSDAGVRDIKKIYSVFETMEKKGLPLLLHGEATDPHIDIFQRERVFIDEVLSPLCKSFPNLKIVLEHITTKEAVEFILAAPNNIAATITAHHLLLNRNALFEGGINPHHYCLPILKRNEHQQALIQAAISGNPKFFLGTDSAPHAVNKKECSHGCAGIYTSHAAIELYAEVFEQVNALDKLEAFASFFGADFYGLPRNTTSITIEKKPWQVPKSLKFGNQILKPFRAGEIINWTRC